jgi:hypothetical protein
MCGLRFLGTRHRHCVKLEKKAIKEENMRKAVFSFILFVLVTVAYAHTPPETILSEGALSKDALVAFLLANNPRINRTFAGQIVGLYIAEAKAEGVNYEIAFAQMCYHTRFLTFDGTFAKAHSNNFFGLTSFNNHQQAYVFDSYQEGIRAHIQHLKGYATEEPLNKECVDPRYYKIQEKHGWGSSPTIDGLSGKWAGADYAHKIRKILERMY